MLALNTARFIVQKVGTIALFASCPFVVLYWMVPFATHWTIGNDYPWAQLQQIETQFALRSGTFPLYFPGVEHRGARRRSDPRTVVPSGRLFGSVATRLLGWPCVELGYSGPFLHFGTKSAFCLSRLASSLVPTRASVSTELPGRLQFSHVG